MPRAVARARVRTSAQVSPQLIMQVELLHMPSQYLGTHLRELSYANPLLEVEEKPLCPDCASPLSSPGGRCRLCGQRAAAESVAARGVDGPGGSEDWLERVGREETLRSVLWRQVREGPFDQQEKRILLHLIGDLDERGFLGSEIGELARGIGVSRREVERLRRALLHFDPRGIGAQDGRECLMVQAAALTQREAWAATALRLFDEAWECLIGGDLKAAARLLRLPEREVRDAFRLALTRLCPFPTSGFRNAETESLLYIAPDVRFYPTGRGYPGIGVDVVESHRFRVGLSREYRSLLQAGGSDAETSRRLQSWRGEVRRIAHALQQRWETLRQVATLIVDSQHAFFAERPYEIGRLRTLTREQVAAALEVHPSTVGRAVNGKYAQLPDQRLVPLSLFFDSSAPVRAHIQTLIENETAPLSDGRLREFLAHAGWQMSRRAVAMHRESLGILPTHMRRRAQRLAADVL